jgi:hypothetical protein
VWQPEETSHTAGANALPGARGVPGGHSGRCRAHDRTRWRVSQLNEWINGPKRTLERCGDFLSSEPASGEASNCFGHGNGTPAERQRVIFGRRALVRTFTLPHATNDH